MNLVNIELKKREDLSKSAIKDLRSQGMVPGVIYGGDETIHFTGDAKDFKPLVYTPELKVASVNIGGTTVRCIVKDIQFHPVTDALQHVDLLQLIDDKKLTINIPIKFKGVSPGVRAGGKLTRVMRRVKAIVTPESFVDQVTVNVSKLEMGQSVRVRDIAAIEGVHIMTAPAAPVATVVVPRSMRSAATAEAKASVKGAAAEGEGEGEVVEEATEK